MAGFQQLWSAASAGLNETADPSVNLRDGQRPSNDNGAGIGSIRIAATGLLHGPVELALIVNEDTPAEMRLATKDLYDTGFLHAIITEARERIEQHRASVAGRYREPTPLCQLCGVGQGAEYERLAEFARHVLAAQSERDDRVL